MSIQLKNADDVIACTLKLLYKRENKLKKLQDKIAVGTVKVVNK